MQFERLLVTGGAGFVGSNLAMRLKREFPNKRVFALDNLQRRGSELNRARLVNNDIRFIHADICDSAALRNLPEFDLLIDCAAEPSVHAGTVGSPRQVIDINCIGTINCLEEARLRRAAFLFLSTSRVFPIAALNSLPFVERAARFDWVAPVEPISGFSEHGIAEDFSLAGPRSFYGATKLASEQFVQEYAYSYAVKSLINRCGVIAGPWQMGKVDQGVAAHWLAAHVFRKPLSYIGFGGSGKQVRDMLHVDDLSDLIIQQLARQDCWDGRIYNVGGGRSNTISLLEMTHLCVQATGEKLRIAGQPDTSHVDIRIFITDSRKAQNDFNWRPHRSPKEVIADLYQWLISNRAVLEPLWG